MKMIEFNMLWILILALMLIANDVRGDFKFPDAL